MTITHPDKACVLKYLGTNHQPFAASVCLGIIGNNYDVLRQLLFVLRSVDNLRRIATRTQFHFSSLLKKINIKTPKQYASILRNVCQPR